MLCVCRYFGISKNVDLLLVIAIGCLGFFQHYIDVIKSSLIIRMSFTMGINMNPAWGSALQFHQLASIWMNYPSTMDKNTRRSHCNIYLGEL